MFDPVIAPLLCQACEYVYAAKTNQDYLTKVMKCEKPASDFNDIQKPPTSYATVLEYPDKRIVAFQGTISPVALPEDEQKKVGALPRPLDPNNLHADGIKDWLENFRFNFVTSSSRDFKFSVPGAIHEGFAYQLDWIYDELKQLLSQGTTTLPIYLTGHSQGAAIAAIATKALVSDGFPIKATYLFAPPRSGNQVFVDSVKTEVHRFEYGNDIVPHVPPAFHPDIDMTPLLNVLKTLAKFTSDKTIHDSLDILDTFRNKLNQGYVALGLLSYCPENDAPSRTFDMSADEENHMFGPRLAKLFGAKDSLWKNHGLANYSKFFFDTELRPS